MTYLVGLVLWGTFIGPINFYSTWNYVGLACVGILSGIFVGWRYRVTYNKPIHSHA
jgi:hypothetical protein